MDNKGFISLEYIFTFFIILIIACSLLFYTSSAIGSSFNIADDISHRMILDGVANEISQVNSNGGGFSKHVEMPSDKGYFEITVEKSKLTIEYDGKKGETPVSLMNIDSNYRLISGYEYTISKNDEGRIVIT